MLGRGVAIHLSSVHFHKKAIESMANQRNAHDKKCSATAIEEIFLAPPANYNFSFVDFS